MPRQAGDPSGVQAALNIYTFFVCVCVMAGLSYPCLGQLVALRGADGQELWRISVHAPIFELTCGLIDVNKDGHADCLAAGRLSTLLAFDPRNGQGANLLSKCWHKSVRN